MPKLDPASAFGPGLLLGPLQWLADFAAGWVDLAPLLFYTLWELFGRFGRLPLLEGFQGWSRLESRAPVNV